MAISSKASEVASARGAMLTLAGRGTASWSCPSCAESQLAPRRVVRAAMPKAANMHFMESPLHEWKYAACAHGCTAQRMATDAKVQAKDLGGLGSAWGG